MDYINGLSYFLFHSLRLTFFICESGWIGFFWTVWLVTKKSAGFAKHSLGMTGSAIAAYSSVRHVRRHHDFDKISD